MQKEIAREDRQSQERLRNFRLDDENAYAILQLTPEAETRGLLFLSSPKLLFSRRKPEFANYRCVYNGKIAVNGRQRIEILNSIFEKFNIRIPGDFRGHSLSVSDIILLKLHGEVTCWYVDPTGYAKFPDFLPAVYG